MFKLPDDPRVTRVGRLLRRWSIDELPQLLNVIAGDMSLVGPRPEQVELVARYRMSKARVRLALRPGMTGPMQVYGRGLLPSPSGGGRAGLRGEPVDRPGSPDSRDDPSGGLRPPGRVLTPQHMDESAAPGAQADLGPLTLRAAVVHDWFQGYHGAERTADVMRRELFAAGARSGHLNVPRRPRAATDRTEPGDRPGVPPGAASRDSTTGARDRVAGGTSCPTCRSTTAGLDLDSLRPRDLLLPRVRGQRTTATRRIARRLLLHADAIRMDAGDRRSAPDGRERSDAASSDGRPSRGRSACRPAPRRLHRDLDRGSGPHRALLWARVDGDPPTGRRRGFHALPERRSRGASCGCIAWFRTSIRSS